MYKGNMGDFVTKVSEYLKANYECKLIFGEVPTENGGYYIAFFEPAQATAMGYAVYDSDNFEQQIYDYVNKQLENVQRKYDGFSQQSEGLSGEEF